jgi:hypothetical protein
MYIKVIQTEFIAKTVNVVKLQLLQIIKIELFQISRAIFLSVFSSPVSGKRQYTYSSVWTVLSCKHSLFKKCSTTLSYQLLFSIVSAHAKQTLR